MIDSSVLNLIFIEKLFLQMEKISGSDNYILQLIIFTWKYALPSQSGLINYRELPKDSKAVGHDYYHLKLPSSFHPVYYYFHQSKKNVEQFRIERRYQNESKFEKEEEMYIYTLLGGMKIQWKEIEGKNQLRASFIASRDIKCISQGNQSQEKSINDPFFLVKTSKDEKMELKINQIIKLGLVFLKIEEIILDPSKNPNLAKQQILDLDAIFVDQPGFNLICRLCHRQSKSPDPQFVNPCLCKGTMQYICINCLSQWLTKKITSNEQKIKEANVHSTQILSCEVCKTKLPKLIIKNKIKYSLVHEIKESKKNPYLSLMMRTQKSDGNFSEEDRVFITVDEKGTLLGRMEDGDKVVFVEKTVSKDHARISIQQTDHGARMFIKDAGSTYGTLIYQQNFQTILSNSMKEFQIGNSLFRLKIKRLHQGY